MYDYACGVMIAHLSPTLNHKGLTYDCAEQNDYGRKLQKYGICITMLSGCHWRHSVQYCKDTDVPGRTVFRLRLLSRFRLGGNGIFQPEATKRSKIATIPTLIL